MAAQRKNKVTINDVAKAAGVSKTTISRYINGKYEYMSEASRDRIAQVIEELGYRPNSLARSLKSQETKLLGVIVADITSSFTPILLKGISDCCERYGYRILIANADNKFQKERDYILSMLDQRVDGIILNTTGRTTKFLEELKEETETPFVLADRMLPEPLFDTVRSADGQAIADALRYLKGEGYDSVSFFVESLKSSNTRIHRYEAYKEAYAEIFGAAPRAYSLKATVSDEEVLSRFFREQAGGRPAIMTVNGVVTTRIMQAMQNLGIDFHQRCGFCSFDDWPWMRLIGGGLTAIAQPTYEIGRECVKRMMYRLHRSSRAPVKLTELPCELKVRSST